MAIVSKPERKATLAEICQYIREKFAYYAENCKQGWENSIRHNLSLNQCFMKLPREQGKPGKGHYWVLDPGANHMFDDGSYRRRKRRYMRGDAPENAEEQDNILAQQQSRGIGMDNLVQQARYMNLIPRPIFPQTSPGLISPNTPSYPSEPPQMYAARLPPYSSTPSQVGYSPAAVGIAADLPVSATTALPLASSYPQQHMLISSGPVTGQTVIQEQSHPATITDSSAAYSGQSSPTIPWSASVPILTEINTTSSCTPVTPEPRHGTVLSDCSSEGSSSPRACLEPYSHPSESRIVGAHENGPHAPYSEIEEISLHIPAIQTEIEPLGGESDSS